MGLEHDLEPKLMGIADDVDDRGVGRRPFPEEVDLRGRHGVLVGGDEEADPFGVHGGDIPEGLPGPLAGVGIAGIPGERDALLERAPGGYGFPLPKAIAGLVGRGDDQTGGHEEGRERKDRRKGPEPVRREHGSTPWGNS